jgi:hypothetical protein
MFSQKNSTFAPLFKITFEMVGKAIIKLDILQLAERR